jgi:two-component system nitrate/nitrite response regulator NarL
MTSEQLRQILKLTPRERQVVSSLCKGQCNKLIGRELDIAEGTVKQHLANIFAKLGIAKRTALMTLVMVQKGDVYNERHILID